MNWIQFDKTQFCQNLEHTVDKQKHQIDKKVFGQGDSFPKRLPYAYRKIREIFFSMVNVNFKTIEL